MLWSIRCRADLERACWRAKNEGSPTRHDDPVPRGYWSVKHGPEVAWAIFEQGGFVGWAAAT